MIDDMLIGPVILDDRMTGQNYLDFLQNELPKQLEDVQKCMDTSRKKIILAESAGTRAPPAVPLRRT